VYLFHFFDDGRNDIVDFRFGKFQHDATRGTPSKQPAFEGIPRKSGSIFWQIDKHGAERNVCEGKVLEFNHFWENCYKIPLSYRDFSSGSFGTIAVDRDLIGTEIFAREDRRVGQIWGIQRIQRRRHGLTVMLTCYTGISLYLANSSIIYYKRLEIISYTLC